MSDYEINILTQGSIYHPRKQKWITTTELYKSKTNKEVFEEFKKNSVEINIEYKLKILKTIFSCTSVEQLRVTEDWVKELNLEKEFESNIQDQLIIIANQQ